MYLNMTYKPVSSMNYPKDMMLRKKDVMKERNKMGYPKAWNYMKTKTGGHRLKFSEKQFKKFYVKDRPNKNTVFGDFY